MLQEQVRKAQERESRLLLLLENAQQGLHAEQQARRDLEQKLLPTPPKSMQARNTRLGMLLIVLAGALLVWIFREAMIAALVK